MSHRTTAAVILLAGVVLAGFAINSGAEQAASQTNVTDEQITVSINDTVRTDAPDDALNWSHTADVEVNGTPAIEGTHYEWYANNGSVFWYNTTLTENESSSTIDYSYGTVDGATQAFVTMYNAAAPILAILGLAIGGVATLDALDKL